MLPNGHHAGFDQRQPHCAHHKDSEGVRVTRCLVVRKWTEGGAREARMLIDFSWPPGGKPAPLNQFLSCIQFILIQKLNNSTQEKKLHVLGRLCCWSLSCYYWSRTRHVSLGLGSSSKASSVHSSSSLCASVSLSVHYRYWHLYCRLCQD